MAWFDELDEKARQQWLARAAHERLNLSASVPNTSPPAFPLEVSPSQESRQRLAGYSTKVRLQTVAKPAVVDTPVEESKPIYEVTTNPGLPTTGNLEGKIDSPASDKLSGSGMFKSGQCDVAVANRHISSASVVVVMLTGDPGPVVVHYVSLQPGVGFTVHLSAPAKSDTPFNYVILVAELC